MIVDQDDNHHDNPDNDGEASKWWFVSGYDSIVYHSDFRANPMKLAGGVTSFIRYVETHYMSHHNTLIFFVRIGNNLLWVPPCAHTKQLGRTHQKACQVIRVQFALVFYVQLSSECNLPINDICCVLDGGKRASTQLLKVATADPIWGLVSFDFQCFLFLSGSTIYIYVHTSSSQVTLAQG